MFKVITFYEFKEMSMLGSLSEVREKLRAAMRDLGIKGTVILAAEGFNSTVCGEEKAIGRFIEAAESILGTRLGYKSSFHDRCPFRKVDVKIKPEIVTLKRSVDISKGEGTHVSPSEWNRLLAEPDVVVLDTRNDYEYKSGTFRGAINPKTEKFSDLPAFIAENFDPGSNPRIAMFCTGGIRCEKFAPYMKELGFSEVYQLNGGILRYLEETDPAESMWEGECFVFDDRVSVDHSLKKGSRPDHSQKKGDREE